MTTNNRMTQLIRCVSAAAALALVPCFASAAATTAPRSHGEVGTFALGGDLGLDFGSNGLGAGLRLDGNGYYTLAELAPNVLFDLGGSLAFMHNGCSVGDCGISKFQISGDGRIRYKLQPNISLYGDAGLGLVFASGTGTWGGSTTGGVFKITGGGMYQVKDQLYLVFEPLGLNFDFGAGTGSYFHYSIVAGVQYRF
jgi:hypothetical protein